MNVKNNVENYPVNLLDEIAGEEWEYTLPPDILPTVEYVIAGLTERKARIIHMRYRDGMTYDEIAGKFGVTRERIRQIEAKAIRELRHPTKKGWLISGVQGEIARRVEAARENVIDNKLNEAVNNIVKITESLQEITGREVFKTAADEYKEYGVCLDTPIEELELSVRPYNCLLRRGVRTLRELTGLTLGELAKTRNLGKRSLYEVVEAVHDKGLKFKGEDGTNDVGKEDNDEQNHT